MTPVVTVGLPVFNSAATLQLALRSLYAQSLQDWELVAVDDGSQDSTLHLLEELNDPRVRIFHDGYNLGLASRLNQIAILAKGKYLARMDADDAMHPLRLATQVLTLESDATIDVVGTAMFAIDRHLAIVGVRHFPTPPWSPMQILKRSPLLHASIMAKTDWFRENLYNPHNRRSEDHELWMSAAPDTKYAQITEPLMYITEIGSLTLGKYRGSAADDREIFRSYGPSAVGRRRTAALLLASRAKELIYQGAFLFHREEELVRRRSVPPSNAELLFATEGLHIIQNTIVPGWPSSHPSPKIHRSQV